MLAYLVTKEACLTLIYFGFFFKFRKENNYLVLTVRLQDQLVNKVSLSSKKIISFVQSFHQKYNKELSHCLLS